MGKIKALLTFLGVLLFFGLFGTYIFFPFSSNEFFVEVPKNSNFSSYNSSMQFYKNMRFPDKDISYKIDEDCSIKKQNDMERAFEILSEKTLLRFHKVVSNEEIKISCTERNKIKNRMILAGEGGPINVTVTPLFHIITKGQILLIKDSRCRNPNIAIHELLHVLGFKHSQDKKSIMYPVSRCRQVISDDILQEINQLYSVPALPDLAFENVSATMSGRFLSANIKVINQGIKDSGEASVLIYSGGKLIRRTKPQKLKAGYKLDIQLKNIFVSSLNAPEMEFVLNSTAPEINIENNKIKLRIKR